MDLDPGKAVIFKNDKEGNDKRPDYRGELRTPSGEQLRISLWVNEAKSGQKYFGGNVDVPQSNGNPGQTTTAEATAAAKAADDDIPFRVRHRIPSEHRMRGAFDPSF
jgi:hypothetical protein